VQQNVVDRAVTGPKKFRQGRRANAPRQRTETRRSVAAAAGRALNGAGRMYSPKSFVGGVVLVRMSPSPRRSEFSQQKMDSFCQWVAKLLPLAI